MTPTSVQPNLPGLRVVRFAEHATNGEHGYGQTVERLIADRVASSIFAGDSSLWGPAAQPEASIRLGWTDFVPAARELLPRISALRAGFAAQGVDRFVLCGMGGSSLGPAVIARWAGVPLTMLDSTDPSAIARALSGELARTAVIVSSKSGSTIETRSHLAAFELAFSKAGIAPAERVVIVTDPGSPFEVESVAAGRHVILADPHVGGRFSALTAFGLVPAGLAGADVEQLVADGEAVRAQLACDSPENPALQLAAAIFAALPDRFVLTIDDAQDAQWGLGRWVEQLVAESTGKEGFGVLPIALHSDAPEFSNVPANAITVRVAASPAGDAGSRELEISGTLGAQFLLWEVATAALGRLMGIDPFNQPDVESAKVAAREALDELQGGEGPSPVGVAGSLSVLAQPSSVTGVASAADVAATLRDMTPRNGYLAVQAYVDPQGPLRSALEQLRDSLASALGVPVSLGYGPSYLHSVGQLHKGGPALGAFLQITAPSVDDIDIPNVDATFATLIGAQARGDRGVLMSRGRPVLALEVTPDDAVVLQQLSAELLTLRSK